MKIHLRAEMFPMMPEEELAELAEDIRENGLIHPIMLDTDGQVIDGRNRLAACKLAKVEPRFEKPERQGSPCIHRIGQSGAAEVRASRRWRWL